MKVAVIACLEPEHLSSCLEALRMWVAPQDVIVVNNGNRPENTSRIDAICRASRVLSFRPHNLSAGEDSIPYINEALKAICLEFPDEVVLKIDEDILIVTDERRMTPEKGSFLVPNVTINNYTTKRYLEGFWPDLHAALLNHDWMWHKPHPFTGGDFRGELVKRIYTIHPRWLIRFCEESQETEYVDGTDWSARCMMSDRGISSTAMAFHASDYLSLAGDRAGVEEILIAEGVRSGRFRYKVDYGIFCHHVNYWSVRPLLQANPELVRSFNTRILDHFGGRRSSNSPV